MTQTAEHDSRELIAAAVDTAEALIQCRADLAGSEAARANLVESINVANAEITRKDQAIAALIAALRLNVSIVDSVYATDGGHPAILDADFREALEAARAALAR